MNIAVIGAGIAGLAAAVRLHCQGHSVAIFEANAYAGGKLSEFQLGNYRFDAGPSLFTMPQYVEELFALANKNVADYFEYNRLDIVCQYFWDDATTLTAYADTQRYAQEVEEKLNVPKALFMKVLEDAKVKYEATEDTFLHKSLHKISTYFSKDILKVLSNIHRLSIFSDMNSANEKRFPAQPKLVQLLNRYATYNGSNPYQASAILNMIPHLEQNIGAFLPKKGMYDITNSIYTLAKELGIPFYFNTKVTEIVTQNGKTTGIKTATQTLDFDAVVCNMDIFFAYDKLLPNIPKPTKTLAQPKSSSALIFYWGISKVFPQLAVHNIFFSQDYKTEFDHIFTKKTIYEDPTVYINITSGYCPDDAPSGCANWFVMVNVPENCGQNWDELIQITRKNILKKLNFNLKENIELLIQEEAILDPRSIESKTQSHLGSLYGTSSNTKMAAFLRHPNFSKQVKNLYFCGGSVHPGGGIPLCLSSAKIVSELIGTL